MCFVSDTGKVLYDAHGREIAMQKDEFGIPENGGPVVNPAALLDDDPTFAPKVELPDVSAANVRPHWDAPKHPVSRFQEWCQKAGLQVAFEVSDVKGPLG